MEAQKIKDSNAALGQPEDWDDTHVSCNTLHVRRHEIAPNMPVVESAWRPTEDEMAMLNAGGVVILRVFGGNMQPVQLYVEGAS